MPVHTAAAAEPIPPMITGLARRFGAEVALYHDERCVNDVGESLDPPEATRTLEECARRLAAEGVRVSRVQATGAPVATDILDKVKEMDVDLIAITTHGRSGLMHGLFGSVTEAVLRHSPCPVLSALTLRSMNRRGITAPSALRHTRPQAASL